MGNGDRMAQRRWDERPREPSDVKSNISHRFVETLAPQF